jgi:hypothetical protein
MCATQEDVRRVLYGIGGAAWNGSVPVEGGCEVFEWLDASEKYIEAGMAARPDLLGRLPVE